MLLGGKIESHRCIMNSNKIHLNFHMIMFKSMQEKQFKIQQTRKPPNNNSKKQTQNQLNPKTTKQAKNPR